MEPLAEARGASGLLNHSAVDVNAQRFELYRGDTEILVESTGTNL